MMIMMCRAWDVDRREKIDGKWKDRDLPVIEALLIESVCSAAVRWQRIHESDDASPARLANKPRTATAEPMQAVGSIASPRVVRGHVISPLPNTQEDVKREHPATIPTTPGRRSTEPPPKRARASTDIADTEGTGASEHVVRQEKVDRDMDATDAKREHPATIPTTPGRRSYTITVNVLYNINPSIHQSINPSISHKRELKTDHKRDSKGEHKRDYKGDQHRNQKETIRETIRRP